MSLFFVWLVLEIGMSAGALVMMLKGDMGGAILIGLLALYCQNCRLAEARMGFVRSRR